MLSLKCLQFMEYLLGIFRVRIFRRQRALWRFSIPVFIFLFFYFDFLKLYGAVWAVSSAPAPAASYVSLSVRTDNTGYLFFTLLQKVLILPLTITRYLLDSYGQLHPLGSPPQINWTPYPNWYGTNKAKKLALRPDQVSGYIMDTMGTLFPFGGAPTITKLSYANVK